MRLVEQDINVGPAEEDEEDDDPTIAEVTYDNERTKIFDEFKTSAQKWKAVESTSTLN